MSRNMLYLLLSLQVVCAVAVADGIEEGMNESKDAGLSSNASLLMSGWDSFVENLNYSSDVLNQTVHGGMTYEDAMVLMTTIFILNSQALVEVEKLDPGERYLDFKNCTVNAMRSFNGYLLNMAKFFETKNIRYVMAARDRFNTTQEYYLKGSHEAELISGV
ncbi:MAG: hypothetical protein QHG98_01425 [Methanothrix sp.]|jgi:hypothetical protein|uniref:hypothetical protein n=1 Tax=Methanothrix sp. TaxID=90426 RepID=UPI00247DC63A|nr:hypothetical protein [Methanothrix sp.]